MLKSNRNLVLIGQNILNISKRTLFAKEVLFPNRFFEKKPTFQIKTDDNSFVNQLKYLSAPDFLKINLLTQVKTKNDEHMDILRQRLFRIYDVADHNKSEDMENLTRLGTAIMQMFHQLNWPEKALEFYFEFHNEYMDSHRTTLVLMDLLFKNKKYNDILKVNRSSIAKKYQLSWQIRACVYAACYKLNTPECLQYAIDLQSECESNTMYKPGRNDFIAMLALNQKKIDLALPLLIDNDSLPANNIKLLAMIEMNDWKGACDFLEYIQKKGQTDKRFRISNEVLKKMTEKLITLSQSISSKKWESYFCCLYKIQNSRISVLCLQTMDEILCMPIKTTSAARSPFLKEDFYDEDWKN